ncbi:MAG: glutamine--fructose-6-phosphate transaminase (isomerizing) [Elusimicrobiaceae bacterium]|nr:glutamine--fructose-6-phosphate transaminase (isomerizing) [Elusimicrobiaceae bacterium]
MCGIVAYSGKQDCAKLIIEGLKKLEYRGYDSAGISLQKDNKIITLKALGRVDNLEILVNKEKGQCFCAIGHTRWATHGKPCVENSHPHNDCHNQISIVHNGIIENYASLKAELEAKGHIFKSQTDTEVVAHLIEENLKTLDFTHAFCQTIKQIRGAYAICALYVKEPGKIMVAKNQSPMVLGVAKEGVFLASDVPAFLEHTNKAVFLEDGDIAQIEGPFYKIFDAELKEQTRKVNEVNWDFTTAQKGGYAHFMLKEIHEQPQSAQDTLLTLKAGLKDSFGLTKEEAKKIKGIYLVACGTAYHAALCAKYMLEDYAQIPVEVETASEFKYRKIAFCKDWLFIAVSQSGETADTIAAIKNAKAAGLKVMSVCNVLGSTITRLSDITLYTHCGPEISVASTKAFTSQLVVLYSFALNLSFALGHLEKASFDKFYTSLEKLPKLMKQVLVQEEKIKQIAKKIYAKNDFIFLGRNSAYPIALEGALKLKEISYLHAEGFAAGEIKHGPIAVIEEGTPVLALVAKGPLEEKMLSNCQEVKARGAALITISDDMALTDAVQVPFEQEFLFPILSAIVLQFFAYYIAVFRGRDVDRPRNLAKSVTVE